MIPRLHVDNDNPARTWYTLVCIFHGDKPPGRIVRDVNAGGWTNRRRQGVNDRWGVSFAHRVYPHMLELQG